jgi:hypothetical protein
MSWAVKFHAEFLPEYNGLPEEVQDELLARLIVLRDEGPDLGRPTVDTLKGSKFKNLKELRFNCEGVWRFAFAFDSNREAIILVGGDKQDEDEKAFYKKLIEIADRRLTAHIASLEAAARKKS